MADAGKNNRNENSSSPSSRVSSLRSSVRPSYPEIDRLYSDAYLSAVLSVPDRTYEYARDEKITKALEWRRSYGVDALTAAFRYDGGIFRSVLGDDAVRAKNNDESGSLLFVPSQSLVDVCLSGAFYFAGFDIEGRGVLHARTGLFDWWRAGVDDGIRYHVLVIEHVLRMLLDRNKNNEDEENRETSESMVLYIDTSDLSIIPPPMGALTGMARLLQLAYPDRIRRIYIGPVNSVLRTLYEVIAPYLRPRSRDKIVLLECAPNIRDVVEDFPQQDIM